MARVQVKGIIDHLSSEIRAALKSTVEECRRNGTLDDGRALHRAFSRAVSRKCSTWEEVPDGLVDAE